MFRVSYEWRIPPKQAAPALSKVVLPRQKFKSFSLCVSKTVARICSVLFLFKLDGLIKLSFCFIGPSLRLLCVLDR